MPDQLYSLILGLGASRGEVLRAVVAGSVPALGVGLVAGLVAASLSSRALSSALYEIEPSDPVTFASVAFLLLAAGGGASLVPAWRATRVDPVTALKTE